MASKACCSIPPVVTDLSKYEKKGTYETISNLKHYITGPHDAKTGIFVVYDIFGLDFTQTIQGSDILASGTKALTVIPDIFDGKPMNINDFPPTTPEKKQALDAFFSPDGPANPEKTVAKVRETLLPGLKKRFPSVEKWAILGYCWGGKMTTLLSGADSPFVASVQCHPAFLDPTDAAKLTIPHLCLATKDEDHETTKKFEEAIPEALKSKSIVHYWDGTFHGFMAARTDLENPEHLAYYKKGYEAAVDFLHKALE